MEKQLAILSYGRRYIVHFSAEIVSCYFACSCKYIFLVTYIFSDQPCLSLRVCVCILLYKHTFPGSKHSEKFTYMDSYMSNRMAQVPFFSLFILNFIFKVRLGILFVWRISRKWREMSKHYYCHRIGNNVFVIECHYCAYCILCIFS